MILGGPKWDALKQGFWINGLLVLWFLRSILHRTMVSISVLTTSTLCIHKANKQCHPERYTTTLKWIFNLSEKGRKDRTFKSCVIYSFLSSPWQLTFIFLREQKQKQNSRSSRKKKDMVKRQLSSWVQHSDSLPVKMIHSWTRKCFPYSTSGLGPIERVMDIDVCQYHSDGFTQRYARFTGSYLFSMIYFFCHYFWYNIWCPTLWLCLLGPFLAFSLPGSCTLPSRCAPIGT